MATVVTAKGREIIANRMKGTTPGQAEPLNIGWGTNPAAATAAVTDVGPFAEATEARTAGTSSVVTTTTTNDTYQVTGTITVAGAGKTIGEVFLSDSASKPFATTVASGTIIGSSSATGLTTGTTYTPANGTLIQIRGEVLSVTSGTGTTGLVVVRAQNGSAASAAIAAADAVTAGNQPGVTTVTNGTLYLHGDFTGLALNVGDSIAFTIQVKHT